jgi:hypothetical protein
VTDSQFSPTHKQELSWRLNTQIATTTCCSLPISEALLIDHTTYSRGILKGFNLVNKPKSGRKSDIYAITIKFPKPKICSVLLSSNAMRNDLSQPITTKPYAKTDPSYLHQEKSSPPSSIAVLILNKIVVFHLSSLLIWSYKNNFSANASWSPASTCSARSTSS